MKSIPRIARMLHQTMEGDPYYGPSVLGALQGVTAAAAGRRLPGQVHSLWEIVAHITAEYDYARAVLEGKPGPWIEGVTTWPLPHKPSTAGWARAKTDPRQAGRRLARAIASLTTESWTRNRPLCAGRTTRCCTGRFSMPSSTPAESPSLPRSWVDAHPGPRAFPTGEASPPARPRHAGLGRMTNRRCAPAARE